MSARVPAHLKVIRGNPGGRPIKPEVEPLVPTDVPEPPECLNEVAKNEWWRIATELHRLKMLTVVDINPLAAYCQAFARWSAAEQALNKLADRDPATGGILIKGSYGTPMLNPLLKAATQAARDMVKYAGEFGLTPSARARIAAGEYQEQQHKFSGLLAG